MKRLKRVLAVALTLMVIVAFAGCGEANPKESQKFAGSYMDKIHNATIIRINENEDAPGFFVQIARATSNTSEILWTMDCEYNEKKDCLSYKNAVEIDRTFDTDGNETKTTVYEDGTGTFTMNENGVIAWNDDKEDAGADCAFFSFDDIAKDLYQ